MSIHPHCSLCFATPPVNPPVLNLRVQESSVSAVDAFQALAIAAKERQASPKLHPARPFMPPYREQIAQLGGPACFT
jgi:hypothetical protein